MSIFNSATCSPGPIPRLTDFTFVRDCSIPGPPGPIRDCPDFDVDITGTVAGTPAAAPDGFWAQLTTAPGSPPATCGDGRPEGYGWQEVVSDGRDTWSAPPGSRTGTNCDHPAYEVNNRPVPLTVNGLPTVVKLTLSASGDAYDFTIGLGDGREVEGIWLVTGIQDVSGAEVPPPPNTVYGPGGLYYYLGIILSTPAQTGRVPPYAADPAAPAEPFTPYLCALAPAYQPGISGRPTDLVELAPQPMFSGTKMNETVTLTIDLQDGEGEDPTHVVSYALPVYYSWWSPGELACDGTHPVKISGSA